LGIAAGAASEHRIVIDHSLRPLFASVNAEVVPGVYATDADLANTERRAAILERIDRAVSEAVRISAG
jgi:FMN reductase